MMTTTTATTDIKVVHACGRPLHYDQTNLQFVDVFRRVVLCPCCFKPLKLADCRDLEGIPIGNR